MLLSTTVTPMIQPNHKTVYAFLVIPLGFKGVLKCIGNPKKESVPELGCYQSMM